MGRVATGSGVEQGAGESHRFRLPAVDRAMSLLELLASSRRGLTLSELSRRLEIPKSTAYYLVYTLVTRGYVQRTAGGLYSLGFRFADIAGASTAGMNLSVAAKPYLRQIAARLNLTALLAVMGSAEAVIIANAPWARDGDAGGGVWVGRHLDLHCTAQGKALIAHLSEDEFDQLFAGRDLAGFTSRTILSLPALKEHLAEVRANGYAVNDEEHAVGSRAVAAPVIDSWGVVIAAISVRGSTQQIPRTRLRELGVAMVRAARDLSLQSGDYPAKL